MSAALLRRLCLGFIVGVTVSAYARPSFFVLVAVLLLAIVMVVIVPRRWQAYAIVVIMCAVGGLWLNGYEALWQDKLEHTQALVAAQTEIAGMVEQIPDERGWGTMKITQPAGLSGWLLQFRLAKAETMTTGERVHALCHTMSEPFDPARAKGRHEIGSCQRATIIAHESGTIVAVWRAAIQTVIATKLDALFHQPASGFFRALLLGDTIQVTPLVREAFRTTGTSHIIAISGLHFSLLGAALSFILEILLLPPRGRFIALAILFATYVWIVGPSPSVVRGALFTLFIIGVVVFGRSWQGWHTLVLTATVFLVLDPFAIFSISFLLSFSATAGMIVITPALEALAMRVKLLSPSTARLIAGTLGPVIATGPVLLLFTVVPLVSPLANVLIIPLSTALMLLGMVAVAGSFVWWPIAAMVATVLEHLFSGILLVLQWLTGLVPFVIGSVGNNTLLSVVWLGGVGWLAWQGMKALAPRPLLFYTSDNGEISQHSVD